jgi:hypothetical protein
MKLEKDQKQGRKARAKIKSREQAKKLETNPRKMAPDVDKHGGQNG